MGMEFRVHLVLLAQIVTAKYVLVTLAFVLNVRLIMGLLELHVLLAWIPIANNVQIIIKYVQFVINIID